MKKIWLWAMVAAGATAAYLMYRRGEDFSTIAEQAVQHPVSSLLHEAQRAS